MIIAVECAPDPHGEPVPHRLHLGARPVEVAAILDRWPGADHLYVKLRGSDGALYILRHDRTRALWELRLYDAGGAL